MIYNEAIHVVFNLELASHVNEQPVQVPEIFAVGTGCTSKQVAVISSRLEVVML